MWITAIKGNITVNVKIHRTERKRHGKQLRTFWSKGKFRLYSFFLIHLIKNDQELFGIDWVRPTIVFPRRPIKVIEKIVSIGCFKEGNPQIRKEWIEMEEGRNGKILFDSTIFQILQWSKKVTSRLKNDFDFILPRNNIRHWKWKRKIWVRKAVNQIQNFKPNES